MSRRTRTSGQRGGGGRRSKSSAVAADGSEGGVSAVALDGSTTGVNGFADGIETLGGGLSAKVLVLNKLYMAMRVVSAKRAFSLLVRDQAEVIHVEHGK